MLIYGEQEIRLPPGRFLIGRDGACHIVLTDPQVSRRHARLVVSRDGATIEDIGSANGVYVNGERVPKAPRDLEDGDSIFIGHDEIKIRLGDVAKKARMWTPTMETLAQTEDKPPAPVVSEVEDTGDHPPVRPKKYVPQANATDRVDALEMLGRIAEKSIALGRALEAEKMLGGHLENVLRDAKAKKGVLPENRETASKFALKLAVATGAGRWFDYVIELFEAEGVPCPDSVIVELQVALNQVQGINVEIMKRYVAMLQAKAPELDADQNRLTQRVDEVLQMVAARSS